MNKDMINTGLKTSKFLTLNNHVAMLQNVGARKIFMDRQNNQNFQYPYRHEIIMAMSHALKRISCQLVTEA